MSAQLMDWKSAIEFMRKDTAWSTFLEENYWSEDLLANVANFENSDEFAKTLSLIEEYAPSAKSIVVLGAGNGTMAIALAKKGYDIKAIENSYDESIGIKAIQTLKVHFQLENIEIMSCNYEKLNLSTNSVDIVYMRQNLHYAKDLNKQIAEISRILKLGGIFLATRTHVADDKEEQEAFQAQNPLSKIYNGEHAFLQKEYKNAIFSANLNIWKTLKYFDSTINYLPNPIQDLIEKSIKNQKTIKMIHDSLAMKIPFFRKYYAKSTLENYGLLLDETAIPGRFYTYITVKD